MLCPAETRTCQAPFQLDQALLKASIGPFRFITELPRLHCVTLTDHCSSLENLRPTIYLIASFALTGSNRRFYRARRSTNSAEGARFSTLFTIEDYYTNETFAEALCSDTIPFDGGVQIKMADEEDTRLFILPDCFYDKVSRSVSSFPFLEVNFNNLIVSGNSTYNDPLLRLPTGLTSVQFSNVRFINPSTSTYNIDWNTVFTHFSDATVFTFSNCSLTGELPASLPVNFATFNVQFNALTGSIPSTFFSNDTTAPVITIGLNNNQLSGSVTASLLNSLNAPSVLFMQILMNTNRFTGSLPSWNWDSFPVLDVAAVHLGDNIFSGSLPPSLLSSFGAPKSILYNVSANALSGTIPDSMCATNSSVRLLQLFLTSNNFTGAIPDCFSGLANSESLMQLYYLDLSRNKLTGELPATIVPATFTAITTAFLAVDYNIINGTLPSGFFANSKGTVVLSATNNLLTGSIALPAKAAATQIALLLSNNKFTGPLPVDLIWGMPAVLTLDLSSNALGGSLSDEFFDGYMNRTNSRLTLSLANCNLNGTLPAELNGPLTSFSLDVSSNSLTGTFPSLIIPGSSLGSGSITAYNNSLSGTIAFPPSVGNNVPWRTFNLGSNAFSKLSIDSSVEYIRILDLSYNVNLTGTLPAGLFVNQSVIGYLNLSHTAISGDFPDVGPYDPEQLYSLDLSQTDIDFCHFERAFWAPSRLSSCNLASTNASSCKESYPEICRVDDLPVPSTTPTSVPTSPTSVPTAPTFTPSPTLAPTRTPTSNALRLDRSRFMTLAFALGLAFVHFVM